MNDWSAIFDAIFDTVIEHDSGVVEYSGGSMPGRLATPRNITLAKAAEPVVFKYISAIVVEPDEKS